MTEPSSCPDCGNLQDIHGAHALACRVASGSIDQHDSIVDRIFAQLKQARINCTKEGYESSDDLEIFSSRILMCMEMHFWIYPLLAPLHLHSLIDLFGANWKVAPNNILTMASSRLQKHQGLTLVRRCLGL